jgi:hypothetical protein
LVVSQKTWECATSAHYKAYGRRRQILPNHLIPLIRGLQLSRPAKNVAREKKVLVGELRNLQQCPMSEGDWFAT